MKRLVAAALIVLALGACGRKGPPVAPEQRLPSPSADVSAIVREGGIELRWTNPTRRVDNTRVRDLEVVRVFRVDDSGDGEPRAALLQRGRVRGYTEIATIRLAAPAPAILQGDGMALDDRQGLVIGRRYTYTIVAADSEDRASAPSPRVSVTYVAVPELPRSLMVEPGESEARLRWSAPARLADGTPTTESFTYQVLRATGTDAPQTVVRETRDLELTDRGLENEQTYTYAVRAVRTIGNTRAISAATPPVSVTPVDMTAPSPPTDLVAIPSAGTVRLSWKPSPEPDAARYVVYRAAGNNPLERIGSVLVPDTTFTDRDVPSGRYRYAVTAEDTSSHRNESAPSGAVSVSVP